jgi:hypothetical protein
MQKQKIMMKTKTIKRKKNHKNNKINDITYQKFTNVLQSLEK